MISQTSVNQVMGRADIVEVIGQFIRLKKRGVNYLANCPFHNEKTPSFNVSAVKGIYKCFGCGKAGNVVTFLQEHEKLSYPEAIHWLADFYKIEIEETERTPEQQQQQQVGEALRLVNEYAAKWFSDCLLKTEEGNLIGLSYFKQRGFRQETIDKFRLGYNPENNDQFYQAAIKKGYKPELLEKAGFIKNRNGIYHDVYRGRVIFPIQGLTGRILGFGARVLKQTEKAPKYINTPENEIYLKHKVLYGMYQARQAVGKLDECFLVEGYTDVISMHQGGVENVVASSGTSLTEDQLRLIAQMTRNLTILYDGDSAGIKAAIRGLDMALNQSFNVQLVLLPDGDDPDSYIQKVGATQFHEYVKAHKQDVISFRLQIGMAEAGNDPVKKSKLVNEIAESISRISRAEDFSLRNHFIREASSRLQVDEAGFVNLVNKNIRDRVETDQRRIKDGPPKVGGQEYDTPEHILPEADQIPTEQEPVPASKSADEEQEWQLLRVLIEYGHLKYNDELTVAKHIENEVDPELLEVPLVIRLYTEYYDHFRRFGGTPEVHFFVNYPDQEIRNIMAGLLHPPKEISVNWDIKFGIKSLTGAMVYVNDVESTLAYFQVKKILKMKNTLMDSLNQETDPARQIIYETEIMKLIIMQRDILKNHHTVVLKLNKYKFI